MTRRIFVGDVQGCREELEDLLERLRFDPAQDELYPVGDLVNRGPDSLGSLRLLRQLEARAVLGNHDVHLLQCAAGVRAEKSGDTFSDVLSSDEREPLLAWLGALPFVRALEGIWLVHAGLSPAWDDPEHELTGADPLQLSRAAHFAVHARYCDERGNLAKNDDAPPGPPFRPWHEHFPAGRDGRMLVFGHWAAQGLLVRPHARGLDTGCVWGKELTAWIAEEDRLVSVPARRAYMRIV